MSETLDAATKDAIQTAYRAWLKARDFKPRRGQREMIAHVARGITTDEDRVVIVEAGTGTGKTAAYCLAAIPIAKSLGKRVVISTATVALQEQVTLRDLPDLQQHAELEFSFTLAKGRGRYVCLKRLDDGLRDAGQDQAMLFEALDPGHRQLFELMLTRYADGTWDGDIDSWDDGIASDAWSQVTTDHRGCTNNRCSFFHQCAFFKARSTVESADVIVANHDLVLADLSLGGGVVLPSPEDVIFILDEAHHLPEKTQQHFSARSRLRATVQWLEQLNGALGTMAQRFGRPKELVEAAEKLASQSGVIATLMADLEQQIAGLEFTRVDDDRDNHRFPMGDVPGSMVELCSPLAEYFGAVARRLETVRMQAEEAMDGSREWSNGVQAEDWLPVLGQLINRALASAALFDDYGSAGASNDVLMARWVTRLSYDVGDDYELTSVPLEPGNILDEVLWQPAFAAVCTSATLCALGSFERFLSRAGLPPGASQVRIASPFDYPNIATLSVPAMSTDPRDADAHTREIAAMLPELLELETSALVLFTSWRQFHAVIDALPKRVLERCQLQGERSKQALVTAHRDAVDSGEPSYILGLASFAEGVDLPDDYCRHVILTKLPFSVPDDPVDQAFGEWLESQGKNPFFEVAVPDTALRLIQACGRLIRHEGDHGRISLLDRRIVNLRYGRALLDSLPAFRREIA